MSKLCIRKIPFIGSKTESKLNLLNIYTCKDLMERYVDLFYLNEDSFDFYMKNCYGIGRYEHSEYQEEKSISRSESFYMTGDKNILFKVLDKLNERIFRDMDKSKILYCKTITIEVIGLTERKISKCFTNKYGLPNRNSINKIFNFLNNLKNDYKEGVLPNKKYNSPLQNKSLSLNNIKENSSKCNSKTKSKENKKQNNRRISKSKSIDNKSKYKRNKKENKKDKNSKKKYKDILNLFINMKKDKDKIHDNIINAKEFI